MEPSSADAGAAAALVAAAPVFPPGARVVQIGPHHTGINELQWAMHGARAALAEQGVHYAGNGDQVSRAAAGLTGGPARQDGSRADGTWWTDLVEEASAAGDATVVASSESFAHASREHIERLAGDLDPARLRVVRMVRAYDRLLPVLWQHALTRGRRQRLEGWASGVLEDPDHRVWALHGADTLTRRWAEVVGSPQMTVLLVDEDRPEWPARAMERMLGLSPHTIGAGGADAGRSLLAGESEMVRQVAGIFHKMGWSDRTQLVYLRNGVGKTLRAHPADPGDQPVRLAPKNADALAERTRRDLDALDTLGVTVVGERSWLEPRQAAPSGDDPLSVAVDTAVAAVSGVVGRSRRDGGFALGGTWPREFLGPGDGTAPLPPGGARLVEALGAALAAEGHRAQVVERYARTGAAGGLRALAAQPGMFLNQAGPRAGALPDDRVQPIVAAAAVAGAVAAADGRLYA